MQTDFWTPSFTQPEAVGLTRVTAATLDNWLRYAHVQPAGRDESGRRLFSFADLLSVDCMEMLVALFKMPPTLSAGFARRAIERYERCFAQDQADIAAGRPLSAAARECDGHFSFAREPGTDGDYVVEVAEGEQRADAVMLILPTAMIARRLLGQIANANAAGALV